uniref:DNA helicase UvrBC n=1 Tax=Schlesneria paludicola TaxID=360056 RepID=A0A7C4LK57_9PLAN
MKKCGRCSKPAVLHITEIRHGEVQALHLCESCAKEYLTHSEAGGPSTPAAAGKSVEGSAAQDEADQRACPNCGITFKEFRSQGRLGCPHDYAAFQDELLPLLENIHGETQHVGKVPKRAPRASQHQYRLIRLRNELRTAINDEMYERAARLRDEIQSLEAELKREGQ